MKIDLTAINTAVTLVATVAPELTAAYTVLFGIWSRVNPGKTEDDFRAYLRTASQANIDDTAAQLLKDGWTQDADGRWTPPATSPSPLV